METKIKICGLTRIEDVYAVNNLRPDYAGFVFAPSRRRINPEQAMIMRRQLRRDICVVGVYVDAPQDIILQNVISGVIEMVQLHGMETREEIEQIRYRLPASVPIVKAISVTDEHSLDRWKDCVADYLLLDAGGGGTGSTFNHELLTEIGFIQKPWFLAGGINQNNVTDAIKRFSPYGVDVSSGVETDGYKDADKIREMIRSVRHE